MGRVILKSTAKWPFDSEYAERGEERGKSSDKPSKMSPTP